MKTITISLIGNTYAIRDAIRAAGFSWNRDFERWDKAVSTEIGQRIAAGDLDAIKSINANKKGCAVLVCLATEWRIVWESKTAPAIKINRHVSAGYAAGPDTL